LIALPLLISTIHLTADLTERQESLIEQLVASSVQEVYVSQNHIRIGATGVREDPGSALVNVKMAQTQYNLFTPLFKTQSVVCIELDFYLSSTTVPEPKLLFCVGGVWDEKSKGWIFDPYSSPNEIWK
jgi:hypothetical protein